MSGEWKHEWWAVGLSRFVGSGIPPGGDDLRRLRDACQSALDFIAEQEAEHQSVDELCDAIANGPRVLTESEVEEMLSVGNGPAIVLALRDWFSRVDA